MNISKLLLLTFGLVMTGFSSSSYADKVGTVPAYCIKFPGGTVAMVLTWHSPFIHADPNDYSAIGVRMKVRGQYPRDSGWFTPPTSRNNPSYGAWLYRSSGTPPISVSGTHSAQLAITGNYVGISPTHSMCLG